MSGAIGVPDSKSRGRGKSAANLHLIETSYEILEEIQPASVRAVCYRLFVDDLIPDVSKSSTGRVSKQLIYARRQGVIPWEWIVDETREVEKEPVWVFLTKTAKSPTVLKKCAI